MRRALRSAGGVSVTRATKGSSFGWAGIARRSLSFRPGEFGKSDATCPSGPRPSNTRSSVVPLKSSSYDAETEVRAIVVRGHAALVPPPDARAAPIRLELGGELVCATRSRAAGKRDLTPGASGLREQPGDSLRRGLFVVRDDQLGVPHSHGAPAASSRERSIAASSAAA